MNNDTFLPLGTIVKTKKGINYLIIVGYNTFFKDKNFDYLTAIYPMGMMSRKNFLAIKKSDISKVIFEGYKDDQYNYLMDSIGTGKLDDIFGEEKNG